jgi:hypothetical protein
MSQLRDDSAKCVSFSNNKETQHAYWAKDTTKSYGKTQPLLCPQITFLFPSPSRRIAPSPPALIFGWPRPLRGRPLCPPCRGSCCRFLAFLWAEGIFPCISWRGAPPSGEDHWDCESRSPRLNGGHRVWAQALWLCSWYIGRTAAGLRFVRRSQASPWRKPRRWWILPFWSLSVFDGLCLMVIVAVRAEN